MEKTTDSGSASPGRRKLWIVLGILAVLLVGAGLTLPLLLDVERHREGVEQTRRGLEMIQTIKELGIAVIVITHNMLHAFQVADRVVVLRHGVVAGDHDAASTSPEEVVAMITGDFARQAAGTG